MQIAKPLLFFIFTNIIYTETNLDCLLKKINEFQSTKSINFLQDIVDQGEKMKEENNEKNQKTGRMLLGLDDENAKTDFQIREEERDGRKSYIYKFTFDISKAKFLEITYDEMKTEDPKFDGYWYKEVCLTALMDFPEVVKKVAEIFCMEVSTPETFGDYVDLRVGLYKYLYQGFRFVFNEFHSNYSKTATYVFKFELTTEKIFKQDELTERIAQTFDEKFAPEKIKMMDDIKKFKENLGSYYAKWTAENNKDPRWKNIDTHDKTKTAIKSYFGKAFNDLKDVKAIKSLLINLRDNRYSIKKQEEFKYWLNYINYLIKLYNNKGLYFVNISEHIALGCMDVLKKLDLNSLLDSKENFDKCNTLAQQILRYMIKAKNPLQLDFILFNSITIEAIIDKLKLWLVEDFNKQNANYYKMTANEFAKFFFTPKKLNGVMQNVRLVKFLNEIILSKKNVIAIADKYEPEFSNNNKFEMAFILKWGRLININDALNAQLKRGESHCLLKYIRDEIKALGGIEVILHNMDIYLNFSLKITNKAFEDQPHWTENDMRFIFYTKFVDKLSYNLMIRFPDKKKYIEKIIPYVLESDDIFYQDFYYYFDIVSLRFGESFTQFDWDSASEDVVLETLRNRLKRVILELKNEMNGIAHLISKKDDFKDISLKEYRNLILNVMIKQRDSLHYFKSDVYNPNISQKDEDMFTKIINEYKIIKNDEPIQTDTGITTPIIKPTTPKVKQTTGDILEKLFKMQGEPKNEKGDKEIIKYIKFIIDHHDYLPNEIKSTFLECSKNDENPLDTQCLKIYGDITKCRKLNPALLSNNCSGYINGDNFNKCNTNCPEGFKSTKDHMCEKPDVYELEDFENEDCKAYFENVEGFCFPRCPFGWKDMGKWCEKPGSAYLEKFYHTGFLKVSDNI